MKKFKITGLVLVMSFIFVVSSPALAITTEQSQVASIGSILSGLQIKLNSLFASVLALSPRSNSQLAQVAGASATLSLSPSSSTVSVGDIFTVAINLNTNGNNTDGVETNSLNYNPLILEVQDFDTATEGIQIEPGVLYSGTSSSTVNTITGKINFSHITTGGTFFNGQGTLATATFRAVGSGTALLSFDFLLNSTTDTNVASGGFDILTSATGGAYTVSAPVVDPSPTIENINVSASSVQATISYTTNETTDSFVEYGTTPSYGSQTSVTNNQSFSVLIPGLSPNTTYNYRITATDQGGNEVRSLNKTFQTTGIPDTTAPSEITTLNVGNPAETSLDMAWTSVGDDANSGQAVSYEIRRSTNAPAGSATDWWSSATVLSGAPVPKTSRQAEAYTAVNLSPDNTYYFAVRAIDDVALESPLSVTSIKEGTTSNTPDTVAPTISNIQVSGITTTDAVITWDTGESATSQVVFGLTNSYGSATTLDSTSSFSHSHSLSELASNTTYHYAVKSSDTSGNMSISADGTFTTLIVPDTISPSGITDLASSDVTDSSVTLTWLAVGDDGSDGTATSYDIRRSTVLITEGNWATATQVDGEPTPQASGLSESITIGSLAEETEYYFAIKTEDEVPNISGLSNVVTFTTLSTTLPADTTAPIISSITTSSITTTSITVGWSTDELADSLIVYGTVSENLDKSVVSADLVDTHSLDLADLSASTEYFYKVVSKDGLGNQATSTAQSFITTTPPQDPAPVQSSGGGGGGGGGGSVSSGGGGGGGGGSFTDITPPSLPIDFTARSADSQVFLTWENPKNGDFARVVIFRSEDTIVKDIIYSSIKQMAELVYEGSDEEFTDVELQNDKVYNYAIYAYDRRPNYTKPVIIFSTPKEGEEVITMAVADTPIITTNTTSSNTNSGTEATLRTTTIIVPALRVVGPFSIGMTSSQVSVLQNMLSQDKSLYSDSTISGTYGNSTRIAIERFQCKYLSICSGGPSTNGYGMAGPKTRIKLNEILGRSATTKTITTTPQRTTNTRTSIAGSGLRVVGPFSIGVNSNQVSILQRMLKQDKVIYPEGITTGYYGNLTRKAVERFQCKYLSICSGSPTVNGYGMAGPSTRAKINAIFGSGEVRQTTTIVSTEREALIKSIGEQIAQLQIMLKTLLEKLVEALKAEAANAQ